MCSNSCRRCRVQSQLLAAVLLCSVVACADDNPDSAVLSYEQIENSRLCYQKHDVGHIQDEKERRQAGYKLARDNRAESLGEPMQFSEHIAGNDWPFRVRPERVHEALRQFAGIAVHPPSQNFPLGVKREEQLAGVWGKPTDEI